MKKLKAWWNAEPKLVPFPQVTTIFAKNQPEYRQLPAHKYPGDPEGKIVCCWSFGPRDRLRLLFNGRLWHTVLTFNNRLQPQLLQTNKPPMPPQ